MLILPSKLAYCCIFAEMAVHLAYFKDIIFALVTMFEFSGMLYNTYTLADSTNAKLSPGHWTTEQDIIKWLKRLIAVNVLFIVLTLARYCKAAFYRKSEEY
jgi:hypothetical protein